LIDSCAKANTFSADSFAKANKCPNKTINHDTILLWLARQACTERCEAQVYSPCVANEPIKEDVQRMRSDFQG
jgi:hypothetical protein